MDIYIKPHKKVLLSAVREIRVGDVAEVVAQDSKAVGALKICGVKPAQRTSNYLVTVTDIIRVVAKGFPGVAVNAVGETDTLVSVQPPGMKQNALWLWGKVAFVCMVLAVGSATAIMSYHTDGQIPKIFERFHLMFYGFEATNPMIITIPYSVGLAAGIIIFYNHFFTKKLTDDPTPIEVEMELYEDDVTQAKIDMLQTADKND
jgi:stage V sporulation protein AA